MIKLHTTKRKNICCILLSTLLGFISFICYPFAISNGYGGFSYYASLGNLLKGAILFLGVFCGCFVLTFLLFSFLDNRSTHENTLVSTNAYLYCLYAHPFCTSFLTILFFYIPYIVATYPALVHVDSIWILWRVFGYAEMSTHFPLGYSLLFAYSFKLLSEIFNSNNVAFFIMSFGQMLLVICAMAFSIKMLVEVNKLHWKTIVILMLFYIICPRINNYMMNLTKDVLYAAALLFFAVSLWYFPKYEKKTSLSIILLLSSVVMSITRNEGVIVVVASLLLSLIFNKKKLVILSICAISLFCFTLFSSILPSALNITKGSGREMLSIPLMQTARYVFSTKDQVTPEEESVILAAFDFKDLDEMGRNYEPQTSDWTKNRFEYDIFSDDAKAYYKVWLEMLKKRPDIYLSSIIASNYQYLFPCNTYDVAPYNWTEFVSFENANDTIGTNFYYPSQLSDFRYGYEQIRETLATHLPISILNSPGVVTWVIILWFFAIIYRKNWNSIILLFPALIITGICILSPCDGFYCRYQYPLLIFLPASILFTVQNN